MFLNDNDNYRQRKHYTLTLYSCQIRCRLHGNWHVGGTYKRIFISFAYY